MLLHLWKIYSLLFDSPYCIHYVHCWFRVYWIWDHSYQYVPTSDKIHCSLKLNDSISSMNKISWWNIDCMLFIMLVKSLIVLSRTFSDSLSCSSRRSHCWVKNIDINLSLVIFQGLCALMTVVLFWLFPSIVAKKHCPRPSRSCPDLLLYC